MSVPKQLVEMASERLLIDRQTLYKEAVIRVQQLQPVLEHPPKPSPAIPDLPYTTPLGPQALFCPIGPSNWPTAQWLCKEPCRTCSIAGTASAYTISPQSKSACSWAFIIRGSKEPKMEPKSIKHRSKKQPNNQTAKNAKEFKTTCHVGAPYLTKVYNS